MNLLDIFSVTLTITSVRVTAREDNGRYIHMWIIGKEAERPLPPKIKWDWRSGYLSLCAVKINAHGDTKKNGQPEMGWGLKDGAIPAELLEAPITHLGMQSRNAIEYDVSVDVVLPRLTVEAIRAAWRPEETEGERDENGVMRP